MAETILPKTVYAQLIKAYRVGCPYCFNTTFWHDGDSVSLDGCLLRCEKCNQDFYVKAG